MKTKNENSTVVNRIIANTSFDSSAGNTSVNEIAYSAKKKPTVAISDSITLLKLHRSQSQIFLPLSILNIETG